MSSGGPKLPAPSLGATTGVPDATFIRKSVPVTDVAGELSLEVRHNRMIRCWYPERHQHDDRTPSVGVWKRFNRVKCFVCPMRPLGPIDLVIDVLGLNPGQAIRWIAQRFDVPRIPKGKHLRNPKRVIGPVGHEDPLELLVRSGLWALLCPASRNIAAVLISLADRQQHDRETWRIQISYQALLRFSGLGSFSSISKAVHELQDIGWLKLQQMKRIGELPIRESNCYLLTPFSDEVREWANSVADDFRTEMEAERAVRQQKRHDRLSQRPILPVLRRKTKSTMRINTWGSTGTRASGGVT